MARSRNQRILNLATGMVLASALSAASSACANLLTNGSFETGPSPGAGTLLLSGGSTALTGWVVTRGNVDYVGGSWEAQDGACTVALNGDAAGGVAQSFATYPGALYGVSFYLSGDPFTTPALKHVRLAAADSSADFSFDITPAWPWHMDWTLHEWTFTARTASTTLELYSLVAPKGEQYRFALAAYPAMVRRSHDVEALIAGLARRVMG